MNFGRPSRFLRLRWIVLLTIVSCIVVSCFWIGAGLLKISRMKSLVAWAQESGGHVWSNDGRPEFVIIQFTSKTGPSAVQDWVFKYFERPIYVSFKLPLRECPVDLSDLPTIRTLELTGSGKLSKVNGSPYVMTLKLRRSKLTDSQFKVLDSYPGLRKIEADHCFPSEVAFSEMAKLTNLEEVYVSNCRLEDADLKLITEISSLKYLDLEKNSFSLLAVKQFVENCEHQRVRLDFEFKEYSDEFQKLNPNLSLVFSPQ